MMIKKTIPFLEQAKGIIFDLDGTLIDSMPLHFEGYQYALLPWGVRYPLSTFHARAGMPSRDTMLLIAEDFSLTDFDVTLAMSRKREYVNKHLDRIKVIEPVYELLKTKIDKLPIAIGTGSNRHMVNKTLALTGLTGLVRHVVTSDDVEKHKPDPETFLLCARLMEINPSDCVVYEDGQMGIDAAKTAGMNVVDVRSYL